MAPPRIDPVERIMKRVKEYRKCWIYTGTKDRDGYGMIGIGRKQFRTHRVMFERFVRKLTYGEIVCHHCDNPSCVNPDHLYAGSFKDNALDREKRNRSNRPSGQKHPNSKVSDNQRMEIYKLRESGKKLNEIAQIYGISFQQVSVIHSRVKKYGTKY